VSTALKPSENRDKGRFCRYDGRCLTSRRPYLTDLTDGEVTRLEPLLVPPKSGGRPRLHPVREILNAIFYVVRSGCAWRLLPHEFAPWQTAYHYFRVWRLDGTWEHLNTVLREQLRATAVRHRFRGWHHRQPIREDDGCRRCSWLRRRETRQWP